VLSVETLKKIKHCVFSRVSGIEPDWRGKIQFVLHFDGSGELAAITSGHEEEERFKTGKDKEGLDNKKRVFSLRVEKSRISDQKDYGDETSILNQGEDDSDKLT